MDVAIGVMACIILALAVALSWAVFLVHLERAHKRPITSTDFAIGETEYVVLIRVNERGLPTQAQGKGLIPAQIAACCFVVAHNLSQQLAEDVSRTAGYDVPPEVLPFERSAV
jgi:hypothetical protein